MTVKLNKKDVLQTTDDALTLFRAGIKSEETRETYEKRLKEFLCGTLENYLEGNKDLREKQRQQRLDKGDKKKIRSILDADFSIRANELVKKAKENPDEIMGMLLAYSTKLKERPRWLPGFILTAFLAIASDFAPVHTIFPVPKSNVVVFGLFSLNTAPGNYSGSHSTSGNFF